MTTKAMQPLSEVEQDTGNLLTPEERIGCQHLAAGETPHNQRAQALLVLDEGATQEAAGQRSGLTKGQVRYWLGKFRKVRMAIFPDAPPTPAAPQPEPAPRASELAAPAEDAIVDPAIVVKETQPKVVGSAAVVVVTKKVSKKKKDSQKKDKKREKSTKRAKDKTDEKPPKKKKAGKGKGDKKSKKKKKSQETKSGKKKKKNKVAREPKKGQKKKGKKKKGGKKKAGKKAKKKDK